MAFFVTMLVIAVIGRLSMEAFSETFSLKKSSFKPDLNLFDAYEGITDYAYFDETIKGKLLFYNKLSDASKQKFLERLGELLLVKRFSGREGLEVNDEMKILLCGALTMLTFGFEKFKIRGFDYFVIFPNTFYSKLLERQVKGLTVGTGYVYLSWDNVMSGIENPTNGINLALHEMAHALYIDYFHARPNWRKFEDFEWEAIKEIEAMRNRHQVPFLRHYAAENTAEFFAVCVEYFFEKPISFKQNRPIIYKELCKVLKQDPALLQIDKI